MMNVLFWPVIQPILLVFLVTFFMLFYTKIGSTRRIVFLGLAVLFYVMFLVIDIYNFFRPEEISQQMYNFKFSFLGAAVFSKISLLLNIFDDLGSEKISKRKRKVEMRLPLLGMLIGWLVAQRIGLYILEFYVVLNIFCLMLAFLNTKIQKNKSRVLYLLTVFSGWYGAAYFTEFLKFTTINIVTPSLMISLMVLIAYMAKEEHER